MRFKLTEMLRRKYPEAYRKMDLFLRGLREKVDAFAVRERIIVLAAAIFVIFTLWYFAMFMPVRQSAKQYKTKINVMKVQFEVVNKEYAEMTKKLATKTGKDEQKLLKDNIKRIDDRIAQIASQVVPADEMADMLKDLLIKEGKLTFIAMKSLPARTLVAPEIFGKSNRMSLVNQGVEFSFNGNYFNTLKYLKNLEGSKWRLFWDSLSYKVTKYPEAEVTISVHTLVQHRTRKSVKTKTKTTGGAK